MRAILPENLIRLAQKLPLPLFAVGGSVRDFLLGINPLDGSHDWDICSSAPLEVLQDTAVRLGFSVKGCYKNTGALKLVDKAGENYEFTRFRSDKYVRGTHTPVEIFFTDDILLDAKRRDFTVNAIYYDIAGDAFIDPLQGIPALKEKRLSTVAPANKVFGEDGLRLMRLARFAGQLGFSPDDDCLLGATINAKLIKDISPERIFSELTAILSADKRYGVCYGHYKGLKILDQTRVLDYILPELTLGRGMPQRADFHNYDVLEHSLKAVCYGAHDVRLACLLHDVGKPFCLLRDGNSFAHPEEGANLTRNILARLKAPKKIAEKTAELVRLHMYDFNCLVGENKLRRFLVENYPLLPELMEVKQADFSACKDDLSLAPTLCKWQNLLKRMRAQNVPCSLKELDIKGNDLAGVGIKPTEIATILHKLLLHVAVNPFDNKKAKLLRLAWKL